MSDRTSPWFEDLEERFAEANVRFSRIKAYSSGELVRVYAFPANSTVLEMNNHSQSRWSPNYIQAFGYTWAQDWEENNVIVFDPCTVHARYQYNSVTTWPIFMAVNRLIKSDTFQFRVIPIVLEDIAGQKFWMNNSCSTRWIPLAEVAKRFKSEVLFPAIEALRNNYRHFPEEAHRSSVLYTLAWQEVLRTFHRASRPNLDNYPHDSAVPLGAARNIQTLRQANQKPTTNDVNLMAAVNTDPINGVTATLSGRIAAATPLKDRCQIHYSVKVTEDLLDHNVLRQLFAAMSDLKASVKNPTKVTKRRKVLLEETDG